MFGTQQLYQPHLTFSMFCARVLHKEAYPDGGFWKGLNYVFDRREVHGATATTKTAVDATKDAAGSGSSISKPPLDYGSVPTIDSTATINNDKNIISTCVICDQKWASYQGKRKCAKCRMLVLVCNLCQSKGSDRKLPPPGLLCELCVNNHDCHQAPPVEEEEEEDVKTKRPSKIQKN
jgi:hypothetical protein